MKIEKITTTDIFIVGIFKIAVFRVIFVFVIILREFVLNIMTVSANYCIEGTVLFTCRYFFELFFN